MRNRDPHEFSKYIWMDPTQFDIVLNLVAPFLEKNKNRELSAVRHTQVQVRQFLGISL